MYRTQSSPFGSGVLTPGVKQLIVVTGAAFLVQFTVPGITRWFGLIPPEVLSLEVWRLFTYMFLHGGLWHLLLNMLVLYMFGSQLERLWGRRRFLRYYLLCGVGAGLFTLLPIPAFFYANHIGASGAVYGLLLAFGLLFPNAQVFVFFILPMSARHLVVVLGFIALASSISSTGDGVSHIAHLGGFVVGYVLLRRERLIPPVRMAGGFRLRARWREFGRRRRRARFERYDEERRRDSETLH